MKNGNVQHENRKNETDVYTYIYIYRKMSIYIYIERERHVCVNTRIDVWNMKNENMKHKHGTRTVENGNMKNGNTKCEKKHMKKEK